MKKYSLQNYSIIDSNKDLRKMLLKNSPEPVEKIRKKRYNRGVYLVAIKFIKNNNIFIPIYNYLGLPIECLYALEEFLFKRNCHDCPNLIKIGPKLVVFGQGPWKHAQETHDKYVPDLYPFSANLDIILHNKRFVFENATKLINLYYNLEGIAYLLTNKNITLEDYLVQYLTQLTLLVVQKRKVYLDGSQSEERVWLQEQGIEVTCDPYEQATLYTEVEAVFEKVKQFINIISGIEDSKECDINRDNRDKLIKNHLLIVTTDLDALLDFPDIKATGINAGIQRHRGTLDHMKSLLHVTLEGFIDYLEYDNSTYNLGIYPSRFYLGNWFEKFVNKCTNTE